MTELGQVVHGACLVAIFGYTLAVAAHALGFTTLSSFGAHWAEDGFCVSFKDDPFMNSHMLCMFADSMFALILLYISLTSKKTGVREVRENVLSVFLHGMAHASLFFLSAPPPHGACPPSRPPSPPAAVLLPLLSPKLCPAPRPHANLQ